MTRNEQEKNIKTILQKTIDKIEKVLYSDSRDKKTFLQEGEDVLQTRRESRVRGCHTVL